MTSQVDFYISQQNDEASRLRILWRLLPKALEQQKQLLIVVNDDNQVEQLSEQLWEAVGDSFFAHEKLVNADKTTPTPILITTHEQLAMAEPFAIEVVFDLAANTAISGYPRIIVIGNQNPNQLQLCRDKYKAYQHQGITPKTVKV